jgi:aspartate carbamoyltransferase catalytic subunit
MQVNPGSLLDIASLSPKEIKSYLDLARRMDPRRSRPLLRGKRVVLLFYEASTRTRISFEVAAKALGATTVLITAAASSIEKGESLLDTGYTLRALNADVIVMRHPSSGAPHVLSRNIDIPVVNAGDGMHEHPSQGLLDAHTLLQHKKKLEGLRLTIVGDIFHSRVARSNAHLLTKMGAHITFCGPPELAPPIGSQLVPGAKIRVTHDLEDGIRDADAVMLLRIQKERLEGMELRVQDYIDRFQMTRERLALLKRDTIIMHPGPIIRGLELTSEVADHPRAVILDQVHSGVPTRMAILARALGKA